MILCDFGNSRLKLAVADSDGRVAPSQVVAISYETETNERLFERVITLLDSSDHSAVAIASVKPSVSRPLIKLLKSRSIPHYEVHTTEQTGDLVNSYSDPFSMGVDRWLSMLRATELGHKGAMVVNAGTALTIDFVGNDGVHLGGYITAGMIKQLQALLGTTERVSAAEDLWTSAMATPGNTTDTCVRNGLIAMLQGLMTEQLNFAKQHAIDTLFIAGGDAEVVERVSKPVANNLQIKTKRHETLVLEGLWLQVREQFKN